jgi:PIN domain nuclease of toxin-antitoxin system
LLDSHVVLWAADGTLDGDAARLVSTRSNRVWVSAATVWEIEIKRATKRLDAPANVLEMLEESGFEWLSITLEHAHAAGRLPLHHGDPFDRMLVAQARLEGLTLLSADKALAAYEVSVIQAGRT